VATSCEQENETSGSLKCGEFLENMNTGFLKELFSVKLIKLYFINNLKRFWVGNQRKCDSIRPGEIDFSPKDKD
jgi:hypothetical protein